MSFGVLTVVLIFHSGQCNWRSTCGQLYFESNHYASFKRVMSVLFTFECAGEQRRVFIPISCPGYGAYCVWSQGTLLGTFQWSLVARDTWPHGVTFSRSAEICLYPETFKNQKTLPWNTVSWACFPGLERERGNMPVPSRSSPGGQAWMASICSQPGSMVKPAGRTGWAFLLCSGHLLLWRWNSGGL